MPSAKSDLARLRELVHAALVEIEIALDTETYPDWADTKESLLKAIEILRKLERDQMWDRLSRK
jgi:hypothetical protein